MVVSGAPANLAPAFSNVNEVWNYRPQRLNARLWSRLLGGKFDLCLDFSGTDRSALLALGSGAPARIGYRKFAEAKWWRRNAYTRLSEASVRELHTVDFHRALAQEAAGGDGFDPGSGFRVPDSAEREVEELGDAPFVLVHPGTARREKFWPAERWAAVIDHLHQRHNFRSVVTGAEGGEERGHAEQIRRHSNAGFVDLVGQLTLLELAAVAGKSILALGVDSAAMHLAAMQECRQIVLFGPTNPFHWRPRHDNAAVLVAGNQCLNVKEFLPKVASAPMTDLSTDQVCRAIDERLATSHPLSAVSGLKS
jgi:ADP-heptose:LPS heptosyltransferase